MYLWKTLNLLFQCCHFSHSPVSTKEQTDDIIRLLIDKFGLMIVCCQQKRKNISCQLCITENIALNQLTFSNIFNLSLVIWSTTGSAILKTLCRHVYLIIVHVYCRSVSVVKTYLCCRVLCPSLMLLSYIRNPDRGSFVYGGPTAFY